MESMEKFFYEVRPYFFLLGGIVAMAMRTDRLMAFCGLLLIVASSHIIRNRKKHRAWLAT